jgi:hypothetical protein
MEEATPVEVRDILGKFTISWRLCPLADDPTIVPGCQPRLDTFVEAHSLSLR